MLRARHSLQQLYFTESTLSSIYAGMSSIIYAWIGNKMDERRTISSRLVSFHKPNGGGGCSKEKPTLLLMDNHESNCSLEVMDLARENGLTIVTFTSPCSHRLQLLDVSVYAPLKKHYSASVNEWNLSRRITIIYDLPACFARSFYKAFSYDNIESVNY